MTKKHVLTTGDKRTFRKRPERERTPLLSGRRYRRKEIAKSERGSGEEPATSVRNTFRRTFVSKEGSRRANDVARDAGSAEATNPTKKRVRFRRSPLELAPEAARQRGRYSLPGGGSPSLYPNRFSFSARKTNLLSTR